MIYVSSSLMWGAPLPLLMRAAYEGGFSGIEMWAQQFFNCGYDAEEYRALAKAYDLGTTVHSVSWDLNLSSINKRIRDASVREVQASMDLCGDLGAEEITVHPGHMTMVCFRYESNMLFRRSLRELIGYAAQRHVTISMEIMEKKKKEFVISADSARDAAGPLEKDITYTIDVAHCDSAIEVERLMTQLPRVSKFHISNRKGTTYHTSLDEGDFDFAFWLPRLLSLKKIMVLEGYDDSPEQWKLWHNAAYLVSVIPEAMRRDRDSIMRHLV